MGTVCAGAAYIRLTGPSPRNYAVLLYGSRRCEQAIAFLQPVVDANPLRGRQYYAADEGTGR